MYNLTWAQDVINKQASTVIEQNSEMRNGIRFFLAS